MNIEHKKAVAITALVGLLSIGALVFTFISMREPDFVSEIRHIASIKDVDGAEEL